jgi:hypothetical protein
VGLSYETISKLITAQYEKSGVTGEQYIRKIIQIPVMIPDWNIIDVKSLIRNLSKNLDEKYSTIVSENTDLIATGTEQNPREVKCFINNFIAAHEIYSHNPSIKPKELLIIQALKIRWNIFYRYISSDERFRELTKKYVAMSDHERKQDFRTRQKDGDNPPDDHEKVLFEMDSDFWRILNEEKDTIFGITNWRFTDVPQKQ